MGQSLYRLEIIKRRFVKSTPQELKKFFNFIEAQLSDSNSIERESKRTIHLDAKFVKAIKANTSEVNLVDLEVLLGFADESIELCRTSDMADRIVGDLARKEFFFREGIYTELEEYILKLKFG